MKRFIMVSIILSVIFSVFLMLGVSAYATEANFTTYATINITGSCSSDSTNAAAMLIDGLTATTNPSDANWAHFYGNSGYKTRTIVVDIGSRQYVNSVSMTFLQYIDWGIYFPSQVSFYTSNDNVNWMLLSTQTTAIPANKSGQLMQRFSACGVTSTVRYLKAVVSVDVWVYADELKVNGESKINLADGRPVTITGSCSSDSANAATMLADSLRATTSPTDSNWAHFYGNSGYTTRTVVVDLGGLYKVSNIIMTFYQYIDWGIYFPQNVIYYVSSDNINWTSAGQVATSIPLNQSGQLIQDFHLANIDVYARYVKAVVPIGVWAYSDELRVLGLNTYNIANNAPFTFTSGVAVDSSFGPNDSNPFTGRINDTIYGSTSNWGDGKWDQYSHGLSRSIVIDLKQNSTINKFSLHFIHDKASGVLFPRKVVYSVSQNGTDWADVGTVNTSVSLTTSSVTTQYYTLDALNYQARYIKATFYTDEWVFVDEYKVWGWPGVVNGATIPSATTPPTYPDAYCAPGSGTVGGARDMVLIYNGYNTDTNAGLNTVAELTPYVGYKTTGGTITDFMFDSFLFLPYGDAPSGGTYYCDTTKPSVKTDWDYYLNNLFDSTNNLKALNTAVGNVRTTLGNATYKAKVEIAIPYPTYTQTNFGDVDGDGYTENLNNLADREEVIKWYVDQVLSRWSSAGLANLDLGGFYWYEEQANFQATDYEAAMLSYAGSYVRSKSKVLNWIPYYQSSGFTEYDSLLSMDEAIMQPNYCFSSYAEGVLDEAADICKKYGMGIEMEIHWDALTNATYRTKYYAYLNHGLTKGYMTGAVHMYYQNGGPGTFYDCCNSTDPALRNIYDQTYNFIKRTYVQQ